MALTPPSTYEMFPRHAQADSMTIGDCPNSPWQISTALFASRRMVLMAARRERVERHTCMASCCSVDSSKLRREVIALFSVPIILSARAWSMAPSSSMRFAQSLRAEVKSGMALSSPPSSFSTLAMTWSRSWFKPSGPAPLSTPRALAQEETSSILLPFAFIALMRMSPAPICWRASVEASSEARAVSISAKAIMQSTSLR
mmetsp:Transcript_14136/g.25876  ORF Transcript_14136/g.25876 Transcript_14136/m.25876 type:complete len:201 (-) Transcript_14136:3287-3889(-)